jgi:hypothetical protein
MLLIINDVLQKNALQQIIKKGHFKGGLVIYFKSVTIIKTIELFKFFIIAAEKTC